MNGILFIVVVILGLVAAWENRNNVITIQIPVFYKKKPREFKSFRYIETSKGIICIEETRHRVI